MADHCPDCTDTLLCAKHTVSVIDLPQHDPVAEARSLLAEHERQQDEACRAEIEAVLAKYGRKLQITQPQITIVPL
ncbi:hypothetical protein ACF09Y_22195 [Streptomyces massasporeus]|uniref:hypothetical protein n=1 Tax=Streptomyces massasporeus TaxID=67324 RepID=UPI0036FEEBB3